MVNPSTRNRLLEAAEREFAAHSFHETTVQRICTAAGANVAAVDYHFGSKYELYLAAIEGLHDDLKRHYDAIEEDSSDPFERLSLTIRQRIRNIFDDGKPERFRSIIYHEISSPTAKHADIRRRFLLPQLERLSRYVGHALDTGSDTTIAQRFAHSIHCQIVWLSMLRRCSDSSSIFVELFGSEHPAIEQQDDYAAFLFSTIAAGIAQVRRASP